jgi:hypothetical protein
VAPLSLNEVQPVLGPQARRAMRLDTGGGKRLRLLVLLAAFADAGEPSPSAKTLRERLGVDIKTLDALLKRLECDRFLEVAWRSGPNGRNVYRIGERRRA